MDTDLVGSAIALQSAKLSGEIQIRVAKKILDGQRSDGNTAVALVQAADRGITKAGDQLVAAATGLGGNVDAYG